MAKTRGKKYLALAAGHDRNTLHSAADAIDLIKSTARAKFDETIEAHIRLGVDPKKSDQNVRGTILLPNGTGRSVKVIAFAKGDKAKEAEAAGADIVGEQDLIDRIKEGFTDFDVADGCSRRKSRSYSCTKNAESEVGYGYAEHCECYSRYQSR